MRTAGIRPLATDPEQVAFWRRHTLTGVALCVVLPLVVVVGTALTPAGAASQDLPLYLGSAAVALLSLLLLLVPVERVVRHRWGRLFFDGWEGLGVTLVTVFALLDGGARSPYVMFFYVLLAHAALSYPPLGMTIAGVGNVVGYLVVASVGGGVPLQQVVVTVLTLVVATATCAFASYNHARAYRRTAALAHELFELARRDSLTGCLNHGAFHERLGELAPVADAQHPLSLLVVDVDRFKGVNDTHGHPAGDEVLRLVAQAMAEVARDDDVAGRLGGDEFALLLPGTPLDGAVVAADRLRAEVRARTAAYGATVSVGAATVVAPEDGAGLVAAADAAVYRAKRSGRDRSTGTLAQVQVGRPRVDAGS